jgi:predicted dinucleotide-binding enzyme
MQIGIIGTGRMGSSLGKMWAKKGHRVFFGSRDPDKAKIIAADMGTNIYGGSIAEAAAFGNVVLLSVVWAGVAESLKACGNLDDKVLLDCTLPIIDRQLAIDPNSSGAQEIARMAPSARVVKAFNTIYYEHFEHPELDSERISMFYCGDDDAAMAIAAQLGSDIGFDVVDCGPLFNARWLEGMAYLWIYLAYGVGYGPEIGFRFLKSKEQ